MQYSLDQQYNSLTVQWSWCWSNSGVGSELKIVLRWNNRTQPYENIISPQWAFKCQSLFTTICIESTEIQGFGNTSQSSSEQNSSFQNLYWRYRLLYWYSSQISQLQPKITLVFGNQQRRYSSQFDQRKRNQQGRILSHFSILVLSDQHRKQKSSKIDILQSHFRLINSKWKIRDNWMDETILERYNKIQ